MQDPGNGSVTAAAVRAIRRAARAQEHIAGLTHKFYRYPARFSPTFVATAVSSLSRPGDLVLDPYMGGGTTMVEAFALGRLAVGCDLNSLAVFITRAKVSPLTITEQAAVLHWAGTVIPSLSYHTVSDQIASLICPERTRNLTIPRARPAKKFIALALLSLERLPTLTAQEFGRAILLNVAQWALHSRKTAASLADIRNRIGKSAKEMLEGLRELETRVKENGNAAAPVLAHATAKSLPLQHPFSGGRKADLVLTSPPYPGVHLLYHRWQVDGRKETPAPYWIADCFDGKGSAYYNFASRSDSGENEYFAESLETLRAIRAVMNSGSFIVQMIAFASPQRHLPKYLANMVAAGFEEVRQTSDYGREAIFRRIWRAVPNRAWHAAQKGSINSSREVVLIHRAI